VATRVVVTGIGLVSPRGNSLSASLAALAAGESGLGRPTLYDDSVGSYPVAEVKGFSARDHFRIPKAVKLTNRAARFAVAAARMAIEDAAWREPLDEVGVVLGAGASDMQIAELARALADDHDHRGVLDVRFFAERILAGLTPLWLLVNLPNMSSAHVSIQLGALGPNSTVMTDWVAGSQAIGEAFEWIRGREAVAVLAGGAESGVAPFAVADYEQAGLLAPNAQTRGAGEFVLAEGAAVVLLEAHEHAERRGARIRAELCAYQSASSAIPGGSPVGSSALDRTMSQVLVDARWRPGDVRTVVPASIPVRRYREAEEAALARVFGDRPRHQRSEFRSQVGHALAATGPVDLALALGTASSDGAMLANALGFSGQAVTLGLWLGDGTVPKGGPA
jgi:3-oxoacyl-[acyl-carrier-protein] synthase II